MYNITRIEKQYDQGKYVYSIILLCLFSDKNKRSR